MSSKNRETRNESETEGRRIAVTGQSRKPEYAKPPADLHKSRPEGAGSPVDSVVLELENTSGAGRVN